MPFLIWIVTCECTEGGVTWLFLTTLSIVVAELHGRAVRLSTKFRFLKLNPSSHHSCERTVFLEVVYFTSVTLVAHTVLSLRVYAVTGKNRWIAGGLYALTILQFGVGVYLCVYSFLHPRMFFPFAACGEHHANQLLRQCNYPRSNSMHTGCAFSGPRPSVHSSIPPSPLYSVRGISTHFGPVLNREPVDFVAFLVVLIRIRALKTQRCDSNTLTILDTVTKDTAMYFLVIFSSHFVLVLTLTLVRVRTTAT